MDYTNGNGYSQPEEPKENEIQKYLRILKKRKWLILITFLVMSLLTTTYVVLFGGGPTYTAETLLTFQNPNEISAVEGTTRGRGGNNAARLQMITSNRLLGKVVSEMQLNVSVKTPEVTRSELFAYTDANEESIPGEYRLVAKGDSVKLYFGSEAKNITERIVATFAVDDSVYVNRFAFKLNKDYFSLHSNKNLEFSVRDTKVAINSLRAKVAPRPDRRQTMVAIQYTHKSPKAAATVLNNLADNYVELNLDIKRSQKNQKYGNLKVERDLAQEALEKANRELQAFKEKNPWVQVSNAPGNQSGSIGTLEASESNIGLKIQDLESLLGRMDGATDIDDKMIVAREMITYLTSENVPQASAFDLEFQELSTSRTSLLTTHAPTHQLVRENEAQIATLLDKVTVGTEEKIEQFQARKSSVGKNIASQRARMRSLPEKERRLADLLRNQRYHEGLLEQIANRYNQARISVETEVSDVYIIDRASVPVTQSALADIIKKSAIGMILALAMALGLAFVLEFFDKTVTRPEDLQTRLRMPVIGSIPVIQTDDDIPENLSDIKGKRDPKLITLDYSPTLESESYRDIRTKILFMNQSKNLSSLLITSLSANEGKSLTCSNIAITIAQQKISTLLVDADLRRGVLHNVFGNKKNPGLSDFLISKATVDDDNVSKLIQKTFIPNLYLITTGSPIPNPTEMIGSERMAMLLKILKSRFGMVIVDTAPLQASSDSAILSTTVEGSLVVVRANHTNVDHLRQKILEYPNLQRSSLGLILNMVKTDIKKTQYQSQYSYYNY